VGPALTELLFAEPTPYQVAATLLEELRRDRATVLVIEDAHWADEATLDVLRLLARRIATARVLIVLSYRDDAVDARHPLRVMLEAMSVGTPQAEWWLVEALSGELDVRRRMPRVRDVARGRLRHGFQARACAPRPRGVCHRGAAGQPPSHGSANACLAKRQGP